MYVASLASTAIQSSYLINKCDVHKYNKNTFLFLLDLTQNFGSNISFWKFGLLPPSVIVPSEDTSVKIPQQVQE